MDLLRKLEARTRMMSTKRRVKAKIAEALGLEKDEEACRLAREVKSLGRPRGVADSSYRTCMKVLRRVGRSLKDGIGVRFSHTTRSVIGKSEFAPMTQ